MLQIIKLSTKTWKHVDSIEGNFILTKFYAKEEFNEFLIIESYGAKRRKYLINEIEVYDIGGSAETFANFEDLFLRLEELGYTAFYQDGEVDLTPVYNAINLKQDKLTEVNFGAFMDLDLATKLTPMSGDFLLSRDILTNEAVEIPFSTVQPVLVSGTNIKTINGNSVLGSGDLVITSTNKQIFQWWGGNWTTTTLGNYYYIGYNGAAIEGPTNTISGSMNGRNKGLFIAPFNCKIKRVMFKEAGSGTYTGAFVLASGLPNYGGTWNNGYSNVVTHLNSAITSVGSNQNKFEYLVTDNITVPKGYAVCPMLVFSAQASASKLSIEISIEIEEVV